MSIVNPVRQGSLDYHWLTKKKNHQGDSLGTMLTIIHGSNAIITNQTDGRCCIVANACFSLNCIFSLNTDGKMAVIRATVVTGNVITTRILL